MRRLTVLLVLTASLPAAGLVASSAEAATSYTVSAVASTTKLDVGQVLILRGKVVPNAAGRTVLVQVRTPGSSTWKTIKKPVLSHRSKYVTSVKVTAAGTNNYRVVKPAGAGHRADVSPVRALVGWRWRTLTKLPVTSGPSQNTVVLPSGVLGENSLPQVFRPLIKQGTASGPTTTGTISYRLDENCSAFDAHVGLTIDSVDGEQFAEVSLAGSNGSNLIVSQHLFPSDDPAHVIRSGQYVLAAESITLYTDVDTAGSYVGWGNPRVYCRS